MVGDRQAEKARLRVARGTIGCWACGGFRCGTEKPDLGRKRRSSRARRRLDRIVVASEMREAQR